MKDYLKRFGNTGTIMSIVGLLGNLLILFGLNIDTVWLNNTALTICNILVLLGIANNPTTKGLDLPAGSISAADSASTPTGANVHSK